jgi:siroheme synthase
VLLVHNASLPDQRVIRSSVAEMCQHEMPSPVVLIVGQVVSSAHETTEAECASALALLPTSN